MGGCVGEDQRSQELLFPVGTTDGMETTCIGADCSDVSAASSASGGAGLA
jgi:hypothetical protein